MKNVCIHIVLTAIFGLSVLNTNAQTESFVVRNVNVVDVLNGGVVNNRDVLIENGRISQITRSNDKKTNLKSIDGSGKFLMPGLWDFHVHALALPDEESSRYHFTSTNSFTIILSIRSKKVLIVLLCVTIANSTTVSWRTPTTDFCLGEQSPFNQLRKQRVWARAFPQFFIFLSSAKMQNPVRH